MTAPVSPIGNIIALKGQVWAESEAGLRPLEAGSPVYQGDKIVTGPGSNAEIRFLDDTCLSQGADSALSLDQYVYNPADESASIWASAFCKALFATFPARSRPRIPKMFSWNRPLPSSVSGARPRSIPSIPKTAPRPTVWSTSPTVIGSSFRTLSGKPG